MRMLFALLLAFTSITASSAEPRPPNIVGSWQGTLQVDSQTTVRVVFTVTRANTAGYAATMFADNSNPIPVDSMTVSGSMLDLKGNAGHLIGWIGADGNSIRGVWMYGNPRPLDAPMPLELLRATPKTAWSLPSDGSPHTSRYITVDKGANLEVLGWGGSGRPIVLLTGGGGDAHGFDDFAPKLTARYHVYGITRRGFGNSSAPLTGYTADRLGDDVVAVLDALELRKPVLIAISLGGEELSAVGSRYPQRVAGLVYLDAGYPYAFDDPARGNGIRAAELWRKLDQIRFGIRPPDKRAVLQQLVAELPPFTQALQRTLESMPVGSPAAPQPLPPAEPYPSVIDDVMAGVRTFTTIPVPILAIFAAPHEYPPGTGTDEASRAAADARDEATTGPLGQSAHFEHGLPSAHVVRLPHAAHDVIHSNEPDVLREMNAFIATLPE